MPQLGTQPIPGVQNTREVTPGGHRGAMAPPIILPNYRKKVHFFRPHRKKVHFFDLIVKRSTFLDLDQKNVDFYASILKNADLNLKKMWTFTRHFLKKVDLHLRNVDLNV